MRYLSSLSRLVGISMQGEDGGVLVPARPGAVACADMIAACVVEAHFSRLVDLMPELVSTVQSTVRCEWRIIIHQ